MSKKNIISIKNITKSFGGKTVVDNVNLDIKANSITGIIGRNGSGKTVLLKMIAQLYFPTKGSIEVDDKLNINDDFGFLIDTGFLDNETGFNNLKMLSLLKNKITEEDIINIMKFVMLDPFDKTKYKNFSTGMKQKLKLAQALMESPSVLMLDEPFSGLDKESVNYFRKKFKEMKLNDKITIIITSHYQEDIDHLCDYVYQMVDGKLYEYET